MASVSSSHLILFIASLIIAASVAGTFTQGVQRLSSALGDRSIDVSGDIRTDISIISDPGSGAVYNESENNVTVLVKNTGSRSLPAESDRIDVLIDGQYQATATVTVLDGPSWRVGNVAKIEFSETLAENEDHRVAIIVNNDKEVLKFRT
ncbi:CARDB domain-containing protein [Halorussus caseinilyticus]|uniref:CARDB domain-containing protein n=1 Tax=Halorussus caseinilyticus TaxID=3034025 RepID=UPI0023E84926|nr:CARDB domain-containing protein [Halorussus sp. DT72]